MDIHLKVDIPKQAAVFTMALLALIHGNLWLDHTLRKQLLLSPDEHPKFAKGNPLGTTGTLCYKISMHELKRACHMQETGF